MSRDTKFIMRRKRPDGPVLPPPATTDEPELRAAVKRAAEVLDQSDGDRYAIEARSILRTALTPAASDDRWAGLKRENDMLRQMLAERAVSDGSLDVAWAAAEAACEKRGLVLEEVARFNPNGWWTASAWEPKGDVPHTTATEQGVVAALTKLAARLSESPSEGKTE